MDTLKRDENRKRLSRRIARLMNSEKRAESQEEVIGAMMAFLDMAVALYLAANYKNPTASIANSMAERIFDSIRDWHSEQISRN